MLWQNIWYVVKNVSGQILHGTSELLKSYFKNTTIYFVIKEVLTWLPNWRHSFELSGKLRQSRTFECNVIWRSFNIPSIVTVINEPKLLTPWRNTFTQNISPFVTFPCVEMFLVVHTFCGRSDYFTERVFTEYFYR